jgi:Gram-negative bacterial TonB protein C-terminal
MNRPRLFNKLFLLITALIACAYTFSSDRGHKVYAQQPSATAVTSSGRERGGALHQQGNIKGVVILHAVLSVDGTVQNIPVRHSLPPGLTEKAVEAPHQIKLIPATKDRRPVSQFIQIEYNFSTDY